jgi:hypothetical protein
MPFGLDSILAGFAHSEGYARAGFANLAHAARAEGSEEFGWAELVA